MMIGPYKEVAEMRKLGDRENMIPIDKRCMEKGISRRELARRSGVPTDRKSVV